MNGIMIIPTAVSPRKEKASQLIELKGFYWRPLGGSNPCYRRERAVS